MDIKLILTQFGVVGLYALFQNGRHVSILLFSCKLALVASLFNSKFKRTFSLTHWPGVTGPCLSSASDIITFDQNWQHLYWTSARGKDLSSDADQSDWPNGAWKSWVKNSEHGKNCLSRRRFLRSFLTATKPSRRPTTAAKRKGENGKVKKIPFGRNPAWKPPKCPKNVFSAKKLQKC